MKAVKLKQVDLDYRCHMLAYLTQVASAQKPVGKGKSVPVYKTFEKFFDYRSRLKEASEDTKEESSRLSRFRAFRKRREE